MSARPSRLTFAHGRGPFPLLALALGAVALLAALWLAALLHSARDGGSLDSRVNAVGETVRCPICAEGIPLDDVTNPQADQMRALIRQELRQGLSEDQVRQDLAGRYGADILLAPRQQGFDALAWFVPLLVVAACAVALLLSIRRWSGSSPGGEFLPPRGLTASNTPVQTSNEARRYEELLDRELQRRE